jgi:galactitol PTS system EIIA component
LASEKILSLLVPSAVCVHLQAESSTQVLQALGDRLFQAGYVRDSFVAAALEREAHMPTGLPLDGQYNAAIPHTDIEHVIKPGLALATLAQPVNFQNMIQPEESVPVRLVILMALEQAKTQVEMLQEIAGVLQDSAVIEKLIHAQDVPGVQAAFS